MKTDIHPKYHTKAKAICACGNTFTVGSTIEEIHVEICSNCHPFYTGKQKILDAAGRVDRFKKRTARTKVATEKKLKPKTADKAA
ncbi:50S ribosomal protein L31 [Patescibacteria group bacterium]|nr:50S ribosomal protein L31 [Patescibacteria group bacterium]